MLQLSASLISQPILSLRTGGEVATTIGPVLNPNNLKVEGLYCEDRFNNGVLVLLTQDIRDRVGQSFVVDDHEVLAEPDELIRLESVLKLGFDLIGKPVYSDKKRRIGKITDYAVDDGALYVQKLYVSQSLMKNLGSTQLTVDRSQIVEITDRRIVIKDPLQGVKDSAGAPAIA